MPPRKDLIMSKWIYTIKKGEALYSAIYNEDVTAITTLLVDISEDIDSIDIDTIDFWLDEFYDLADNSRVWVGQI